MFCIAFSTNYRLYNYCLMKSLLEIENYRLSQANELK